MCQCKESNLQAESQCPMNVNHRLLLFTYRGIDFLLNDLTILLRGRGITANFLSLVDPHNNLLSQVMLL